MRSIIVFNAPETASRRGNRSDSPLFPEKALKGGITFSASEESTRSIDETQLQSVEEARKYALEVAQEAHEKEKARAEDEEAIVPPEELQGFGKGGMG